MVRRKNQEAVQSAVPGYIGHRGRMRAKLFEKGISSFTEDELLEVLLMRAIPRRDVKPIARELLRRFKTFANVINAKPEDLCQVKYVKGSVITLFLLIRQVYKTLLRPYKNTRAVIDGFDKLIDYLCAHLDVQEEPFIHAIYLDRRCQVLASETICSGDDLLAGVQPKDILKRALNLNTHFFVLISNRPTGDVESFCLNADEFVAIERYMTVAGIKFYDHLVINANQIYSKRSGYFSPYRSKSGMK